MSRTRYVLAVVGAAALSLAPVSLGLSTIGLDAAFAKNGGNGNGGEKGGGEKGGGGESGNSGKSGGSEKGASSKADKSAAKSASKAATAKDVAAVSKPGKGKLASELKGLNAAHASAQAFANASDKSRVGRIRAYREAYEAGALVTADAEAAAAEVARLAGLTPEQIAAEFPDPVGYDQAAYDAALAEAEAAAAVSGVLTGVDTLRALTPEERATMYPSNWDAAAAQAEAIAAATEAQAIADAAAAEAAGLTEAALANAGGANLSDEAREYLNGLLEGKVVSDSAQEGTAEEAAVVSQ